MAGLTPKQEAFALAYHEGGNASEAYRRAYDADRMSPGAIHVAASRLLANPKIALRLSELKATVAARHAVTLDSLTDMVMTAYAQARKDGSAKGADAMVKAAAQLSRMHGFDVRERENKRDPFEALDAAERERVLDAVDRELARRKGEAGVVGEPGQA